MAIRAADVQLSKPFAAQVEALRAEFPGIDDALEGLKMVLRLLGDRIPHFRVEPQKLIYLTRMDYPAAQADGKGMFIVTYHATPSTGLLSPIVPPRVYTLLTIEKRRRK